MDLLDRYLQVIEQKLPRSMREDVPAELRAILSDMIEERAQTKLEKADEADVTAILQEFGSPEAVARSYRPANQFLIGPDYYPIYWRVVQIVTLALAIAFAVIGVISLWRSGDVFDDLGLMFIEIVPQFVQAAITSVGMITLVFAILERVAPETAVALDFDSEAQESWDPRTLPPLNDPDRLQKSDHIADVIATFFALVFVNTVVRNVGVAILSDGTWQSLPIISEHVFDDILPWFNVLWIAQILFGVYLLRQGRWQQRSRWMDVGIKLFGIGLVIFILSELPLLAIDNARLAASGWAASDEIVELFTRLVPWININLRIVFLIVLVVTLISLGKQLFNLWRQHEIPKSKMRIA